jgi:hypothetical protein
MEIEAAHLMTARKQKRGGGRDRERERERERERLGTLCILHRLHLIIIHSAVNHPY